MQNNNSMDAKTKVPLITTIIPTYKRPKRLKKAIQSVLNQTFRDFQVCIYDNASGDETKDIVNAFASKDPRVKYHCHKEDIGAVENFQYGLSRVNTPYFSFLSDDDLLLPEFYETTLKGFEKYPDAGVSAGAVINIEDNGEVIGVVLSKWPDREYYPPPEGLFEMIGKDSSWTGSLFKTELVSLVGPLDLGIKTIDTDFSFRIAARFPLIISKKPVAIFISHPGSYSKNCSLKLYWPGWSKMIATLQAENHLSEQDKVLLEQRILENLRSILFGVVVRYLENKKYSEACKTLEIFTQCNAKLSKKNTLKRAIIIRMVILSCRGSKSMQFALSFLLRIARLRNKYTIDRKENKIKLQYKKIVFDFIFP